jgi:uncharacterized protein YgiM (DUF1202 family)
MSILVASCEHRSGKQEEGLYVTAPQTFLRDRVAPVYSKTGTVNNGDRVVVLEHGKRWERVRNSRGEEGWLQDRFLTSEDVYAGFQQLYRKHQSDPAQVRGVLKTEFRLHLTPGRDTDRLFLLKEGEKVELLERASVSKAASSAPPPLMQAGSASSTEKPDAGETTNEEEKEYKSSEKPLSESSVTAAATKTLAVRKTTPPARPNSAAKVASNGSRPPSTELSVPMEDWWLIRDTQGRAGWVLGRMIDVDAPLEIAQYAEGQRIVAFFPLTSVHDSELGKDMPYYLVLLTEPRDGMPFDYNQLRVFSWNVRKHRYETAYRDHNIFGLLPASVGQEEFEKVGTVPTFTIHARDEDGNTIQQKYRLEGVIVKRVLAPGETATKSAHAVAERRTKGKPQS